MADKPGWERRSDVETRQAIPAQRVKPGVIPPKTAKNPQKTHSPVKNP
jgi:hypothetical protein